jgi:hypothetical protein
MCIGVSADERSGDADGAGAATNSEVRFFRLLRGRLGCRRTRRMLLHSRSMLLSAHCARALLGLRWNASVVGDADAVLARPRCACAERAQVAQQPADRAGRGDHLVVPHQGA